MQGYSVTAAPRARSFSERAPMRSLGRVTTISLPFKGKASNQSNFSESVQTLPTTMMAGLSILASAAAWGSAPRVEMRLRWRGVVPRSMTAAGISASMPASKSPWQMAGSAVTPMRKTKVPPVRFKASKSMVSLAPALAWPVMIWRDEQKSRWVTGMPA